MFKIGDNVKCKIFGRGKVVEIKQLWNVVVVEFESGFSQTYSSYGKLSPNGNVVLKTLEV